MPDSSKYLLVFRAKPLAFSRLGLTAFSLALPLALLALFFLLSSFLLPFFSSRSFSGQAIPQIDEEFPYC
jgi:hypothetical protein